MKIQTKLMSFIGGTAALITLVVLSLAAIRLNSILQQLDDQNAKINFEYMAYNAEAVAALENSLANMALGRVDANLRHMAERRPDLQQAKGFIKDFLKLNDLLDSALLISRKALPESEGEALCELSCVVFKKDSSSPAISEKPLSFKRSLNKLGPLAFSSSASLLFSIEDQDLLPGCGKVLLMGVSLPPPDGFESFIVAYPLGKDFLLKAVRPRMKGVAPSSSEQAIYAIAGADLSILLAAEPGGSFRVPKDLYELVPGALGKSSVQVRPSRLVLSFRGGNFAELAPQGEDSPWILGCTPLIVDLHGGSKASLLKLFPYPKLYSCTDIARNAKVNIDGLVVAVSFLALFGLLLFFPPLFMIAKGISEPLASAVSFSNALAKGEFPPESLKMSGSTEISALGRSLNHMRDRLCNTISKLKKSHEREMQARKDAEAANHLKSDFLANMSLELRNPLNSVMGFSTLILKDIEKGLYDESLKGKAKAIYESAETLNSLVSTLLDLSKLDTANVETHPSEFETAALMKELVESSLQAASEKGVTIENHFSPDAPVAIFTDRDLLAHTLGLLASSLIRSVPGGKKICFGCFVSGGKVLFKVRDCREPRQGDALAEMYLRYSSSQTELLPTFAGTTLLNLTIAKNQAHILGADFEAESGGDDANSSFTLSFLKNELIPAGGTETSSIHMASNWRSSGFSSTQTDTFPAFKRGARNPNAPIKVLMAEDNEANRMLVELMLKDGNCVLDAVPDGESCLKALASKKYDILLLDLHMPRLDGYSVLSRIREDRSMDSLPVVVLTAYLEEGDKEKLVQMGASKCILKPINIDELLNTIRAFTS